MPGTGQCAAAICAPLRLLVNTRDDAALWLLLQDWRFPDSACSAAPFGTALRDAAIKSRLSPYQQLLTWARRGIYGEDMTPAEVSCARRLIAAERDAAASLASDHLSPLWPLLHPHASDAASKPIVMNSAIEKVEPTGQYEPRALPFKPYSVGEILALELPHLEEQCWDHLISMTTPVSGPCSGFGCSCFTAPFMHSYSFIHSFIHCYDMHVASHRSFLSAWQH